MDGTSIREDAEQLMSASMALNARLASVDAEIGSQLGGMDADNVASSPNIIQSLRATITHLTAQMAELKASMGEYAEGSDLVSAAMAAAAIYGTPEQKMAYLLKRGWKQNDLGGVGFGELGFMSVDSAMSIQTRKDSEAFKPLLK